MITDSVIFTIESAPVSTNIEPALLERVCSAFTHKTPLILNDDEKTELCRYASDTLSSQLLRLALIQYRYFCLTQEWGEIGEPQIQMSFLRQLLSLSPDTPPSSDHLSLFNQSLLMLYQKFSIDALSAEDLKHKIDTFCFTLLNIDIPFQLSHKVNELLSLFTDTLFLQAGFYGTQIEFILGTGTHRMIGDYHVRYFHTELIKSANTIPAMAAVIGNKEIFVRSDALETIFYMKWISSFNTPPYLQLDLYPEMTISAAIKDQTRHLYHAKTSALLAQAKTVFLSDLADNVTHHEIGHGIIQHHQLSPYLSALGEASRVFKENIFTSLLEVLADLAPAHQALTGTLTYLCQESKTDLTRATRMFWMYLSDVWFFDTDDQFMYEYSAILVFIMSQYIRAESYIDFDQLNQDLLSTDQSDSNTLIQRLIQLTNEGLEQLLLILKNAPYSIQTQPVDFEQFKQHIKANNEETFSSLSKYEKDSFLFSEVIKAATHSSKTAQRLEHLILDTQSKTIQCLSDYYNIRPLQTISDIQSYLYTTAASVLIPSNLSQ